MDGLEHRLVLSQAPASLGAAAQFAALSLNNAPISNMGTIAGDVGVSSGGSLWSPSGSTITGNVVVAKSGQTAITGKLQGSVIVSPSLLVQANTDALGASTQDAAMTPTQCFGSIVQPTTIVGNGGVNVISIAGSVSSSIVLSGSANDVFVVNVSGNMALSGTSTLGITGGVTANHVLYNFTGTRPSVAILSPAGVNGTLLVPRGQLSLSSTCNGAVIAGSSGITVLPGARINLMSFQVPTTTTGAVVQSGSQDVTPTDLAIALITADSSGKTVNLATASGTAVH